MNINEIKLAIVAKKNEAANRVLNDNLADKAEYRYMQGYIQGLEAAYSFVKQLGVQKIEDDE